MCAFISALAHPCAQGVMEHRSPSPKSPLCHPAQFGPGQSLTSPMSAAPSAAPPKPRHLWRQWHSSEEPLPKPDNPLLVFKSSVSAYSYIPPSQHSPVANNIQSHTANDPGSLSVHQGKLNRSLAPQLLSLSLSLNPPPRLFP